MEKSPFTKKTKKNQKKLASFKYMYRGFPQVVKKLISFTANHRSKHDKSVGLFSHRNHSTILFPVIASTKFRVEQLKNSYQFVYNERGQVDRQGTYT